jgi:hypothetical protein
VNVWKVILATLVIYSAGLLTGALLVKQVQPRDPPLLRDAALPLPVWMQQRLLERMRRDLKLAPAQTARLEAIFAESQARVRILRDLINPELQSELHDVYDRIRAELAPDQRAQFEQLLKQQYQQTRSGDRHREPRGPGQRGPGGGTTPGGARFQPTSAPAGPSSPRGPAQRPPLREAPSSGAPSDAR